MNRGWTLACLEQAGTVPEAKQELIITWMLRPIISKVSFMVWEGTTSWGEVVHVHAYVPQPRQRNWLKLIKASWAP